MSDGWNLPWSGAVERGSAIATPAPQPELPYGTYDGPEDPYAAIWDRILCDYERGWIHMADEIFR